MSVCICNCNDFHEERRVFREILTLQFKKLLEFSRAEFCREYFFSKIKYLDNYLHVVNTYFYSVVMLKILDFIYNYTIIICAEIRYIYFFIFFCIDIILKPSTINLERFYGVWEANITLLYSLFLSHEKNN